MKFRVLDGCIAVSILVTLNARWLLPHQREIIYILKPLTVLLMVALAMLSTGANSRYRKLITAGLCCSLAGDIFLMLPANLFLPGLILFFCAHVFYLSAFMVDRGPVKQKGVLLLLLPACDDFACHLAGHPSCSHRTRTWLSGHHYRHDHAGGWSRVGDQQQKRLVGGCRRCVVFLVQTLFWPSIVLASDCPRPACWCWAPITRRSG